jgi:hypothetical protein
MSKGIDIRDGVGLAQLGDTLVALWKAPASFDRWRYQLSKMETMAVSRPGGIICLDLILEGSSPPDAALRKQLQSDLRRMGSKFRRFVVVPLGNSIWLSVVRTIVRGVLLVSGQSQRLRVASTVREGLDEIRVAATPETPSPQEVLEAIGELSTALDVQLPQAA